MKSARLEETASLLQDLTQASATVIQTGKSKDGVNHAFDGQKAS